MSQVHPSRKTGKKLHFLNSDYVFVYFVTTATIFRTGSVVLVVHIDNMIFGDYMVGKTCLAIIIMCLHPLQCSDWPPSTMCWVTHIQQHAQVVHTLELKLHAVVFIYILNIRPTNILKFNKFAQAVQFFVNY
jgi:hypothetical protein